MKMRRLIASLLILIFALNITACQQEKEVHKYVDGVCIYQGCGKKDPSFIEYFTTGSIKITKEEVQAIVSQEYVKPRNVIVMIGDGMGPNDLILTEKYSAGIYDFGLIMNLIPNNGWATTHSADSAITDSAASGTALATGVKTNNGMIGMAPDGTILKNISEIAREEGKKIGIVTNDNIVGATPSAFSVHNVSRLNVRELEKSYVDFAPDVLIGQTVGKFTNHDLTKFLISTGMNGMDKINSTLNKDYDKPFLGFFKENTTAKTTDTLAHYTEVALNRLKNNDEGFFLMIENTSADNAGHSNDMKGKLNGVPNLERAIAVVLKFMKENPDTLLIITSDHECGGVQLPEEGKTPDNSLFTSDDHTGVNVRTFAVGYGAEYFNNKTIDNTDIAKFAIKAVKGELE